MKLHPEEDSFHNAHHNKDQSTGIVAGYIVTAVILFFFVWLVRHQITNYDTRPDFALKSPAYIWTPGCSHPPVNPRQVPSGCIRREYGISNPQELGLFGATRSFSWFRIGDDAYLLSCYFPPCFTKTVARNKYKR